MRAADESAPMAEVREDTLERLGNLWHLTLQREISDPDADFFRLGGDSIQLLELLFRVHDTFAIELSPEEFLAAPTLRTMAASIERRRHDAS